MRQLLLSIILVLPGTVSFAQNTFPTSGNAGIGTLTPNYALEVAAPAGVSGVTRFGGGVDYGNTPVVSVAPGTIRFDAPGIAGGRFTILGSNGNVGIGTNSPQFKLDINGQSGFKGNLILYGSDNGGQSNTASPNLIFQGTDYAGASMISAPTEETYGRRGLAISTHSDLSDTRNLIERFRITYAGNVGIGTSAPTEKLAVNGKIRSHEIKVEATNWPDYVFEDTYKATSLSELESYIKTNKHLPEIPSAKEVEENGISLGEMNAKLLKKIEEMTLLLIEKEKMEKLKEQRIVDIETQLKTLSEQIKSTSKK